MSPGSFFAELKRRNVYKVAVAYAVIAWLLIQAGSILFPTFEAPTWVMKVFVVVIAAGFPVALVLAWAFEMTPQGVKRTEYLSPGERIPQWSRRKFAALIATMAAVAAGLFLVQFTRLERTPSALSRTEPTRLVSSKSIAVLPFENLSEDKANAYFAAGIHDEIITRLAKIGELKVISRSSTQRYRSKGENVAEIARQLGVAHVVEGSVQKVGDRVRINVQLIEAQKDQHLWADLYDRNLTDIFAVQSEVATAIARMLQAKLTGLEQEAVTHIPTNNLAAYDAYLRGLDLVSRSGMGSQNSVRAAELFDEAVRLDPNFALAWGKLSEVNASLYFRQLDASQARKEAARLAAETATKLTPDAPETLFANAYYRYHVLRDWEGARPLFEKIRQEVPSNSNALRALASIARRQGRWTDALKLYEEAARLNPRDADLLSGWSWTIAMTRQLPAARAILDRALNILPDDQGLLASKATLYQSEGNLPAAAAVLARIDPASSHEPVLYARIAQFLFERKYGETIEYLRTILSSVGSKAAFTFSLARLSLAQAQELAGDKVGAKATYSQTLEELETFLREQPANAWIVSGLATAHAGLGDKAAALREGERSMALLPATEDPTVAPGIEEIFARTEAHVGEVDRAIARLERLLTIPHGPGPVTQALLRLDPAWDPLRQHPRFKALLEGPEPKTIYQ